MNTVLFTVGGQAVTLGYVLVALVLLVVALGVGYALGRASRAAAGGQSQGRKGRSPSDDAFMRGLTHMMADHTDQAIEEFTRAVTLNSETVETYVVLGNLFRQKGEIERAVRIRESIIARTNLHPEVKLQALYDLGLDYRKGGLYNRAADAFQQVLEMDPGHTEALAQLVSLYEEIRDWEKAFAALKRLDRLTKKDSRRVLAHYLTERGKELMAAGKLDAAEDALEQAIKVDKGCLDAYLHLGDLELARGRVRRALNLWRKAVKLEPVHAHLVVNRVAEAEEALGEKTVQGFFAEIDPAQAEVFTLMALAEYHHAHGNHDQALDLLRLAVKRAPRQLDAHRLLGQILVEQGQTDQALAAYRELLAQIDGEWATYQCSECGFVSHQLTWKCPRCHAWDTMSPRQPGS
jgi:lipopolysaccharide biosynthesis regulator YciM